MLSLPDSFGRRWRCVEGTFVQVSGERLLSRFVPEPSDLKPDYDDPATRGCLLALVREHFGPHVQAVIGEGGWQIIDAQRLVGGRWTTLGLGIWCRETEVEALLAALDAADHA